MQNFILAACSRSDSNLMLVSLEILYEVRTSNHLQIVCGQDNTISMQHITVRVSRDQQPAYIYDADTFWNFFSPVFPFYCCLIIHQILIMSRPTFKHWDHIRFLSCCQSKLKGIVINVAIWQGSNAACRNVAIQK